MDRLAKLKALGAMHRVASPESPLFVDVSERYARDRGDSLGDTDHLYIKRLRSEVGDWPIAALTRASVETYITTERLLERGNSKSAVRRELTTLQAVLNFAYDVGIAEHPTKLRKPNSDKPRDVWLDSDGVERFLSLCGPEFKPFATVLFFTGMRLSEALNARWEHVRGNILTVESRKGGVHKTRSIPLVQRVLDLIGTQGTGWLLKRSCGSQWTKRMVYQNWNPVRDMMGMPELTPHCARHSFASNLIIRGADSRTVAELLGHSSMDMMKRYTHLNTTHLTEAVSKLV
jgi:integrase